MWIDSYNKSKLWYIKRLYLQYILYNKLRFSNIPRFFKESFVIIFPHLFKRINYTLEFKNKKTPHNLIITTCKRGVNGKYVVEFWDINKDYHSLKPLEENLEMINNKEYSKFWKQYGNKRVLISKKEFKKEFQVIEKVLMQI